MSNINGLYKRIEIVGTAVFAILCSCIIVYSTSRIPLLERKIISCIVDGETCKEAILMFACMYTLRALFKLTRNHTCAYMGNALVNRFRENVMQEVAWQNNYQTDIYRYSVLTNDLPVIADLLSSRTFVFIENFAILVFAIYNMGKVHFGVSIVFVLGVSLLFIGATLFMGQLRPLFVQIKNKTIDIASNMKEFVILNKIIWSFDQQSTQRSVLKCRFDEITYLLDQQVKLDVRWKPIIDFLSKATFSISMILGTILIFNFDLDIGLLVLINSYSKTLTNVTLNMGEFVHFLVNSGESVKRYRYIMTEKGTQRDNKTLDIDELPKKIEFVADSVIKNGEVIFDKLDIELRADEISVFLGGSGTGKTILANVLSGVEAAENAQLFFDGKRIFNQRNYWDNLGFCQQVPLFFSSSIKNNIELWKPDVDLRYLEEFCELGFVKELFAGYDTIVNAENPFLSGGERQLVCLARSMSQKPHILILDDCLESIDIGRRERILMRLQEHKMNRIIVILTSNESLCRIADRVYRIENKSVIQNPKGGSTYA